MAGEDLLPLKLYADENYIFSIDKENFLILTALLFRKG